MEYFKKLFFGSPGQDGPKSQHGGQELSLNAELDLRLAQEGFLAVASELAKDSKPAPGLIGEDRRFQGVFVDFWQRKYQDGRSDLFISAFPDSLSPGIADHLEGVIVAKVEIHTTADDGALAVNKYTYIQNRGVFKVEERFTKELLDRTEQARKENEASMQALDAMVQDNERKMMESLGVSDRKSLRDRLRERFAFFESLGQTPPEFVEAAKDARQRESGEIDLDLPEDEIAAQLKQDAVEIGYSCSEPQWVPAEEIKKLNEYLKTFLPE